MLQIVLQMCDYVVHKFGYHHHHAWGYCEECFYLLISDITCWHISVSKLNTSVVLEDPQGPNYKSLSLSLSSNVKSLTTSPIVRQINRNSSLFIASSSKFIITNNLYVCIVNAKRSTSDRFAVGDVVDSSDANDDEILFVVAALQHIVTHRLADDLPHSSICTASDDPRVYTTNDMLASQP